MIEDIKPLPLALANRARALNIEKILLDFSGGCDEGYLSVHLFNKKGEPQCEENTETLRDKIETWAWEVYEYSGAGDGTDYGDILTYDLAKNEVRHQDWSMERIDRNRGTFPLEIE